MAISFLGLEVRSERRLRLVFSNTLAAGAFGVPGPSYYTVTCTDGVGPSPAIAAAMIVPGMGTNVELALAEDVVKGAAYEVSAVGVPAVDLSTTPGGPVLPFRWGFTAAKTNVEPVAKDRERLLYGADLLWMGSDYAETSDGDLAEITGTANVSKALTRGVESEGLPWDPTWGGRIREFVDSPSTTGVTIRGALTSQILRDPRVQEVRVEVEIDGSNTYLHAQPTLLSGEEVARVTQTVPNDAT